MCTLERLDTLLRLAASRVAQFGVGLQFAVLSHELYSADGYRFKASRLSDAVEIATSSEEPLSRLFAYFNSGRSGPARALAPNCMMSRTLLKRRVARRSAFVHQNDTLFVMACGSASFRLKTDFK